MRGVEIFRKVDQGTDDDSMPKPRDRSPSFEYLALKGSALSLGGLDDSLGIAVDHLEQNARRAVRRLLLPCSQSRIVPNGKWKRRENCSWVRCRRRRTARGLRTAAFGQVLRPSWADCLRRRWRSPRSLPLSWRPAASSPCGSPSDRTSRRPPPRRKFRHQVAVL